MSLVAEISNYEAKKKGFGLVLTSQKKKILAERWVFPKVTNDVMKIAH